MNHNNLRSICYEFESTVKIVVRGRRFSCLHPLLVLHAGELL
jgi:hypothetical protein